MATAQSLEQVQKIFIAFYQRPADPAGLKYWADRVDVAGGKIESVIDAFATSAEAKALYGTIDATNIGAVIDKLYMALFNVAPDAAGKQFYVDGFTAGTFTAGSIAYNVIVGATGNDQVAVNNKLQAANEFTQQVDGRVLSDAYFGTGSKFNVTYSGDADALAARDILKGVTSLPGSVLSPAEITDALKTQIADATDPIMNQTGSETFTLTTGTDVASANVFDAAPVVSITGAQIDTLQTADKLTGTGTNPTLNVTLGSATGIVATPTLKNIETINLQAQAAAQTLNLSNATGLKTVNMDLAQQSTTLLSVKDNIVVGVSNANATAASNDVLVRFADSVVAGTADVAKLNLTNNGSTSVAGTQLINLSGTSTGGFETLEITATGANRIAEVLSDASVAINTTASAANSVRTVKVGGEGSLRIDTALTTTTTFDATGNKGGVNVTLNNAGDIKVTGGDGNDTFVLGANLTNTDDINGGAGRDTVVVTAGTGLGIGNKVSNVEVLRVNTAAAFAFDNDDIASIDTIVHATAGAMTYTDMNIASAADATKGLTILDIGTVAYNLKGVGGLGGSDNGVYIKVGGTNAGDAAVLQTAGGGVGAATGTITTDASSMTLDVASFGGQTATGTGAITANSITSLTIKGGAATEAFAVGAIGAGNAVLTKIDGSAFTGNLTVAGTAGAQVIMGGSGNDVLGTGGRGTAATLGDVLTGGTGNDSFVFAAADSTAALANAAVTGAFTAAQKSLFTSITDLNLGGAAAATQVDTVNLAGILTFAIAGGVSIANGGAAAAMTGTTFGGAVDALINGGILDIAGVGGTTIGTAAVAGLFTWGTDTFLIVNDAPTAATTYTTGSTIVICVTGVTGTLDATDLIV